MARVTWVEVPWAYLNGLEITSGRISRGVVELCGRYPENPDARECYRIRIVPYRPPVLERAQRPQPG